MRKSIIISTILALSGAVLITYSLHYASLKKLETQKYEEAITTCNNLYDSAHLPKEELTKKSKFL